MTNVFGSSTVPVLKLYYMDNTGNCLQILPKTKLSNLLHGPSLIFVLQFFVNLIKEDSMIFLSVEEFLSLSPYFDMKSISLVLPVALLTP